MNTQEKIEQRRKEAAAAQKRNKKRAKSFINDLFWKRLLGIVIVVALLAGIFALVFPKTGLSRRMITAVEIDGEKVSAAEFSYYYFLAYNNYYQTMVSYLGQENVPIDTSVSLEKQQITTDMTYAEYFTNSAVSTLTRLYALEKEAKAAGFTASETEMASKEEVLNSIQTYASYYNYSVDDYLAKVYGLGFNTKLLEKCLDREILVSAYENSVSEAMTYTDEQIEAYYQANTNTYDTADVRIVQYSVVEAAEATETTAAVEGVTLEEAKAKAEAFAAGVKSEADYEAAATAKFTEEAESEDSVYENKSLFSGLEYSAASAMDQKIADYVFNEEHAAGDMEIIESTSGTSYYVVYISSPAARDSRKTVDVRHILIQCDTTDADSLAEALLKITTIKDEFELAGATEEAFINLVADNSQDSGSVDNGGLYQNVLPGDMITEFNDWCFDEERQVGDYGIVLTSYGYHLMYLSGQGEETWKVEVEKAMKETDFDTWENNIVSAATATINSFGMRFRNEPIK